MFPLCVFCMKGLLRPAQAINGVAFLFRIKWLVGPLPAFIYSMFLVCDDKIVMRHLISVGAQEKISISMDAEPYVAWCFVLSTLTGSNQQIETDA